MLEMPEAAAVAQQVNQILKGKRVAKVIAGQSPHKFAWYHGDPQEYCRLLAGRHVGDAESFGGMVEIRAEGAVMVFCDGAAIRYHREKDARPLKHQLLVEFDDSSAFSVSVQMYGGLWCFKEREFENPYYQTAKDKPSPLTGAFDGEYFNRMLTASGVEELSAKALLATGQRIPGLGNGVLQDILFSAGIHPKKKVKTFTEEEKDALFHAVKSTLREMTRQGGRDTEKDLFGCPGGYKTRLCRNTSGQPCYVCGSLIKKEAYLGGSIYFCPGCQKVG